MRLIGTLLGLLVSMPLYMLMLYKILVQIDGTELLWFLYWAYVPVTFIVALLMQLGERK